MSGAAFTSIGLHLDQPSPRGVNELAMIFKNIMVRIACDDGSDDRDQGLPIGHRRIVYGLATVTRNTGCCLKFSEFAAFRALISSLDRVYNRDNTPPDSLPIRYLSEYSEYVHLAWLSMVIPRALSVASTKYYETLCGMLGDEPCDFVCRFFLAMVDRDVDNVMLKLSSHHTSFMYTVAPIEDVYLRTYGVSAPRILKLQQVWCVDSEWEFWLPADPVNDEDDL
jgi:hypothetical protein